MIKFLKTRNKKVDPLLLVSNRLTNAMIKIEVLEKENQKLRNLLLREAVKLGYENLDKIQHELERIERIEDDIIEYINIK